MCNVFIVERNQSQQTVMFLGGRETKGGSWSIVVEELRANIYIYKEVNLIKL